MNNHTFKHRSKNVVILLLALLALLLAGCSNTSKAKILHGCGIITDDEYQTYLDLDERGQLNPDGSYKAEELTQSDEFTRPEGSIHVTFAKNAYIEDVQYYLNADLTVPVNPEQCYLMPGDCVYAKEPVCHHPVTDKYKFDRFCVYAHNENGAREKELSWREEEDDTSLVLRIPDDYKGTEISIEPIGEYEERTITLTDCCIVGTDQKQELDGTWVVIADGKEVPVEDNVVAVSSVAVLEVDYLYDKEKYKFDKSDPQSFYHEKGVVRFDRVFPENGIEQFSVELQELSGHFEFDPAQYTSEHGSVTFSYNGSPVSGVTHIDDGQSIHYKLTPDAGYCAKASEGDIPVDAGNAKKTKDDIRNAIKFFPDEDVSVNLPQPTAGGTIEYFVDGKPLSGKMHSLRCGTIITMKFKHWNGWIVDSNAKKEYTVTEAKNQTVLIDGSDISKLFTESDDHKPTLKIIVTDDMKSAQFSVIASENGKSDLSYDKGSKTPFYQSGREIFGGEKVGTGSNIVLSVTDDTIFNGQAMKLEIKTKDTKGNEEKFLQYVTELPAEQTIKLYGAGRQMTTSTVYESVTITVSKVDVSTYNAKSADHAKVVVRVVDDDEPHTLKDGEVLEPSRKVEITIKPEDGWYITGSKLLNGEYSDTMKYSDWEKDSQKILDKHTAQKLWYVTLDTSDSYGTCVYKLDGIAVSGTVGIHEGQKLKLEYTITNPDYEIARSGFGRAWGDLTHKEMEDINIKVTAELDGKTIKRSDYITVVQKEG